MVSNKHTLFYQYIPTFIYCHTFSPSSVMSLLEPPSILDSDMVTALEVLVNSSITIHCDAEGIPHPRVKWLSNGQPISSTDSNFRYLG